MIRHYLVIAIRTLLRNKFLTFINIVGLVIGITAFVLISMYVFDELSYDRFHEKSDRIYRVSTISHLPQEDRTTAMSPPLMGQWLIDNFPEVENMIRMERSTRSLKYKDISVPSTELWYADSSLFNIFSFHLLKGNPKKALAEPYSIVISESTAKKYFGEEDPYGKIMMITDTIPLTVTGIMEDIPMNSHLKADVIVSRSTIAVMTGDVTYDKEWFLTVIYTYVLLNNKNDVKALEAKIKPVIEKYNMSERNARKVNITHDVMLQPLTDIHLRSHLYSEVGVNGNITYVYLFLLVGILVLLIACANYINLSTARSLHRAKEISMRKIIGAKRKQLVTQLLGESFLTTLVSFVVAMIAVRLLIPAFNVFSGKSIGFNPFMQPVPMAITICTFLIVSVVSGCYPAFFMSSFPPIKTLKNRTAGSKQNILIRKGLVVFQFTVSIVLIISVIVIFRQMDYMQNRNLGLNKEQIVEIRLRQHVWPKQALIKEEMLKVPGVEGGAATNFSYSTRLGDTPVRPEGAQKDDYSPESVICTDFDFVNTFDVQLVAGRNFSKEHWTDQYESLLVNESAVKHFNWESPAKAVGKEIFLPLYGKTGKVIGVVRDFNFASLHVNVRPLIVHIFSNYRFLAIKIAAEEVPETIRLVKEKWESFQLDTPFEYSFMDEDFEKLYRTENQTQTIIGLLSEIAIAIACLGLFGLASFTAEQRMKEITIRKVLGANVMQITKLLSKDFILLVMISFAISVPIAWIVLRNWLDSFSYKTGIPFWVFLVGGFCSLFVAVCTVSFQSIKAAMANPVDSLRGE